MFVGQPYLQSYFLSFIVESLHLQQTANSRHTDIIFFMMIGISHLIGNVKFRGAKQGGRIPPEFWRGGFNHFERTCCFIAHIGPFFNRLA